MDDSLYKTITGYLETASRHKWWLILPVVTVFMAVTLWSFTLPKIYQASTLIMVEPQKVPSDYVKSIITGSAGEWLTTIRQQILSRSLLQGIADELGLFQETPDMKKPGLFQELLEKVGLSRERSDRMSQEAVVGRMRSNIKISTVGGRNKVEAFTLSFKGTDPEMVMRVTNRLAAHFIEANLRVREELVEGTSEFLEQELGRLRQVLEEQEASVGDFKRKYIGELPAQMDANLRALDRFQLEMESTKQAIKQTEERKAFLEKQLASGAILSGEPGALEARLAGLKRTLVNLRAEYSESYPDVILTWQQIQEIETQLAQGSSTPDDSPVPEPAIQGEGILYQDVNKELELLRSQETELLHKIQRYERRVEQSPIREQELMALVRDYDNTQNNYRNLLSKRLNAKISENLERRQKGELFRILDAAQVPTRPVSPDRLKIIFLGLAAGLGIGVGLAILVDQMDTSFHTEEDLEKATGLEILAVIPNHDLSLKRSASLSTAYTGTTHNEGKQNG